MIGRRLVSARETPSGSFGFDSRALRPAFDAAPPALRIGHQFAGGRAVTHREARDDLGGNPVWRCLVTEQAVFLVAFARQGVLRRPARRGGVDNRPQQRNHPKHDDELPDRQPSPDCFRKSAHVHGRDYPCPDYSAVGEYWANDQSMSSVRYWRGLAADRASEIVLMEVNFSGAARVFAAT